MRERAPKAIVVSLHKSGTNLVTRLFRTLGYTPIGAGVNESYEAIFRRLQAQNGSPRYRPFLEDPRAILTDAPALLDLCFADSEPGTSVFLHSLDEASLRSSSRFEGVPVVFNYRDPRSVLVSFVHYLTDGAREDFTKISGYVELSEMLKRLPTLEERLRFVMKYVPNYLKGAFLGNAWLLRDPRVLGVSYEALVGAQGGGSDERQLASVRRLMEHLGVRGEPDEVAGRLYDTRSRTFRKGNVAGWKDEFTPAVEQVFVEKYAEILDVYGYAS